MPIYKRGAVEIYYEEAGSGFPLLVIPGGGLNATIPYLATRTPFNPMTALSDKWRCITMDLRNAIGGKSTGPSRPTARGRASPTTSSASWTTSASTSSW